MELTPLPHVPVATAITAAVVGVILNLSIWFALHVFFAEVETRSFGWITTSMPNFASLDWRVVLLTGLSAIILFGLHWGIARLLGAVAIAALLLSQF